MRAFLLGLQHLLLDGVAILVAVSGHGGYHPKFHRVMNVGWEQAWIDLYLAKKFSEVDPVLNAEANKEIVWSERLATLNRRSLPQRRFLMACEQHGMTHGISYIHDYGTHRVTLSLAGKLAENDRHIRQIAGMMHRFIAHTISRILGPRDLRYELSEIDMSILDGIVAGHSDSQTASNLGMTDRSVRRRVTALCKQYGVSTRAQLIYKLCCPPEM